MERRALVSSQAATVAAWVWGSRSPIGLRAWDGGSFESLEPVVGGGPTHIGVQMEFLSDLQFCGPIPGAFHYTSLPRSWAYCHLTVTVMADSDSILDCERLFKKSTLLLLYTK